MVYFATFLQVSYGLTPAGVAIPLAVIALGNILGTVVGGQMADRLPNRLHVFAGAMVGSALVALVLYGWTPGLLGDRGDGLRVYLRQRHRPALADGGAGERAG